MKPGDVVRHIASGRRMTIEAVTAESVAVTWFFGPTLYRRAFPPDALVVETEVSA